MSESKEAKKAKKAEKKAAKANGKKGEKVFKIIVSIILVIAVVAELGVGITMNKKLGELTEAVNASATENEEDPTSELNVNFTAGTYGGIDFKSEEDVVNYYNEVYNKTKSQTAQYKDADGNTQTFYKMVGSEDLQLKPDSLLVEGKANSIINGMVPTILGGMFQANVNGLPPCANRNPEADVDENGASLTASRVVPEDVAACSVTDNGDGTITLVLVPAEVNMSHKGLDAQGHFFNALGAIDSTIEGISALSWASGSTAENCKVIYNGGTATVKVDTASGEIVEADYHMVVNVDITHANVTVLKDKSASLTIWYDQHFPATDEYIMERRQLVRL